MDGQLPEAKNARIIGTTLGRNDHGVMTAYVELEYASGCQSFGGLVFDEWDDAAARRIGHAFGMEFICRLLSTLDVDSWEKLRGQPCRVKADFSKVYAIGHYVKDTWFEPAALQQLFASKEA